MMILRSVLLSVAAAVSLPASVAANPIATMSSASPRYPTSGFGHVDRSGITEHVFHQITEGAIVGGMLGYAISSSSKDQGVRYITGTLLGGVVGGVTALARNSDGKEVRSGDIVLINTAQNIGLLHGYFLPLVFQLDESVVSGSNVISNNQYRLDFGLAATASLVAGGLAMQLADEVHPTPGQAAMVGSGALWGAVSGLLLTEMISPDRKDATWAKTQILSTMVLMDVGMLGAWMARDELEMDRSRALIIDLGGAGGMLVGMGLAFFLNPNLDNSRVILGSLLAGALGGLGSTFYLTLGMDKYKRSAPPIAGGALSLVEYNQGQVRVGLPLPRPVPVEEQAGVVMRPFLSLAEGRF
jgi:hypothetical protein